jgi:hypothetical protein
MPLPAASDQSTAVCRTVSWAIPGFDAIGKSLIEQDFRYGLRIA